MRPREFLQDALFQLNFEDRHRGRDTCPGRHPLPSTDRVPHDPKVDIRPQIQWQVAIFNYGT
jgi:hypothetical protein